jgi:AcrR family transcriptional regulator
MPQIDAPTVAEHRAHQLEALLDAAEQVLVADGHRALNFRVLGERTGLKRNSIYRYFASRDDVIIALCERDMPLWLDQLRTAMAAEPDVDGRVAAFVATQLQLVAAGHHRLANLLGDAPLGPAVRARINALAYRPAELLEPELAALGDPEPALTAQLLQGIVNAGVRLLRGGDPARVEALSVELAQQLVRSRGRVAATT